MPGLDGIEATARLNHIHPDIRVIILASSDAHELIEEAFEAGGRAYVLKSELARDLMPAVAAVMAESRFISESAC